jgi:hypothetical protein
MKRKTIYIPPVTEVLQLPAEDLMDPKSWNPDYGNTGNMGIVEGNPDGNEDDDDYGKGAKEFNPYAFVGIDWDDAAWQDDFKSLWD